MISLIDVLLNAPTVVAAASDDEGSPLFFLLLGPLAGFGFYSWIVLRYRNADKRHRFERETSSAIVDLKTFDQQVDAVRGVRNSQIPGANHRDSLQRLGNGTTVTVVPAPVHPVEEMLRGGSADAETSITDAGAAGPEAPRLEAEYRDDDTA